MEVVQNFNREMKSLLDHRPPVSRQKMSMITKSAIRGIKFYKHIVQSVEKFIQKCSPDYKVPGLYVMDAIIRQSRHQYGAERDVFAPRFLKNLLPTFQQLFRCDEKDRPLVIRVLNLWLKNETFAPEVIQSLLSLADNPEDPNLLALAQAQISVAANNQSTSGSAHRPKRSHHHHHHRQRQSSGQADLGLDEDHQPIVGDEADYDFNAEAGAMAPSAAFDSTTVEANQRSSANQGSGGGIISSVAELLQKFQDADDVRDQINQLQTLQDKILQQSSLLTQQQMIDPEILGQLQVLMEELTKTARAAVEREQEAQRTKDVVAYDYGDDSDDEDNLGAGSNGFHRRAGAAGSAAALSAGGGGGSSIDQNFLDQLQQMTEMLAQTRVLQEQLQSARLKQQQQEQQQLLLQEEIEAGQQADIDQRFQQHQQHYYQQQQQQQPLHISYEEGEIDEEAARAAMTSSSGGHKPNHYRSINNDGEELEIRPGLELEQQQQQQHTGRGRRDRRGSGSGASRRPRSPPTQASAPSATATASSSSSSRRRRRSHSGGRGESSERRRKERKRKALPRLRNGRLSIVSATIFIGKLQKSTTEAKLRSVLEEYGQVQALVLIASRGCGFVVYSKRKHAAKAIDRLRTCRIDGASLRVAWAPNKGIKDTELKEFWDEEEGCTYIPFDKFPRDESWRDLLQGGAFVDQDSVPLELVDLVRSPTPNPADPDARSAVNKTPSVHQTADLSVPAPGLVMPPPPPPPLPPLAQPLQQLPHHLLMMPPPPMLPPPPPPPPSTQPQVPIPHFSAFIPPPPIPPPSRTAVSSSLSPALPGDGKTIDSPAASTAAVRPPFQAPPPLMHQPRTTLLPAPPHQQPHQYVRTPIPAQRPPPGAGFFRGAGIGSGILPMPMPPPRPLLPFGPRGGNIGAGWRGRGL